MKLNGNKMQRLEAQTAKIEAGHVRIPEEAHWLGDFLHEVLAFPHGRHDDQVDALSQLLEWGGSFFRSQAVLWVPPSFGGVPPPPGFYTPRWRSG
jgi:hypothetical protein